jgi:hypothetical protein
VRILLAWGMLMLPKKNQSAISNFAVNLKIKVPQLEIFCRSNKESRKNFDGIK